MEPRIATLLGDSSVDRTTLDPLPLLPPPSVAPLRPHPVEPSAVGDDARTSTTSRGNGPISKEHYQPSAIPSQSRKRQKPSVPIAGVLNSETSTPNNVESVPSASTSSVTPFSGRLSDILLDPTQQFPNKRKRVDEQTTPQALTGSENTHRELPKPPQLPKKTTKRPRIPPLLQGLHQPPPLPQGRLFPPITGEGGGFGREIGTRVGLRSPVAQERSKDQESGDATPANSRKDDTESGLEITKVNDTSKPASTYLSDKENQTGREKDDAAPKATVSKEAKKRNKWSEEETKDLLVGVSRFGIGNWKKILHYPDFNFNQRTAVDLKDRFRTCRPGDGLKKRKAKLKSDSQNDSQDSINTSDLSTSNSQDTLSQGIDVAGSSMVNKAPRRARAGRPKKGPIDLAEMGIHEPFVKNKRRERREFTEEDDENLLKGFEKYGSSWHSMRDDHNLGFAARHPTDLRDRFRIRYPEMFAKAGYKLKPKDELMLKEKEKEQKKDVECSSSQETLGSTGIETAVADANKKGTSTSKGGTTFSPSATATSNSGFRPLALREPLVNSFPSPLQEFGDFHSEEEGGTNRSPIILNRDILQWADVQASQAATGTSTNLPTVPSLMGEPPLNMFNGTDIMHIDPLVTLNLPVAFLANNVLSSTPSGHSASNQLLPSIPSNHFSHASSTSAPATNFPPATSSTKQSMNSLLRTPNLPTIVYPHVPVSSARSAMHNLPPPADLLSGLDLDARPDPQTSGFMLDDNLGFALSSNSTLAPMVGGTIGRGTLNLERGLLEDPVSEKRG